MIRRRRPATGAALPPAPASLDRRRGWRLFHWRRALASGLVGLALWIALSNYLPQPPESGTVVVTTRQAHPAGYRVTAADVDLGRTLDPALGALAATRIEDAVGLSLTGPVAAGEVLTTTRLRSSAGLVGAEAGSRALHLPLADPAAGNLVRPGDRVDIIGVVDGRLVASDVLVLGVDQPNPESTFGMRSEQSRGIVVAASSSLVGPLTHAALNESGRGIQVALRRV